MFKYNLGLNSLLLAVKDQTYLSDAVSKAANMLPKIPIRTHANRPICVMTACVKQEQNAPKLIRNESSASKAIAKSEKAFCMLGSCCAHASLCL